MIFHTAAGADNSGNISLQYPHEDKAVQERQQAEKNNTYLMEDFTMLNEKTIAILEENDITVSERYEQDGEYYREIEFYSPEGEDVCETVWYDGTDDGFIEGFRQLADNFDADEHAEMWIDGRGKRGIPDSVRALIDDAENIKDTLLGVAEKLEGIEKKLHNYKVTITIEGAEEEETMDFYIEAESFDAAVENVRNELDI